jgi:hypothetical protein
VKDSRNDAKHGEVSLQLSAIVALKQLPVDHHKSLLGTASQAHLEARLGLNPLLLPGLVEGGVNLRAGKQLRLSEGIQLQYLLRLSE